MSTFKRLEFEFICRRVFRGPEGVLRRADLCEAFGMSESKASKLITMEVNANAAFLKRDGYLVRRRTGAVTPPHASVSDLMEKLDAGLMDFCYTGLRKAELPINIWKWSVNTPVHEQALELVVEACVRERPVLIKYVGMRRGELGTWRRVVPLCLERMGDQWRLAAQDLEKAGNPVRTFVLARILDARHDIEALPRKFLRASPDDSSRREPVNFNLGLSEVQRQTLGRELRVTDGYITLPSRCWHEFLIRFGQGSPSEDIAWPPLRNSLADAAKGG